MDNLPPEIHELLKRGYRNIANDENKDMQINSEFERNRCLARVWRNLLGEAMFDLPKCLHEYVQDWTMPKDWKDVPNPNRITTHDFVLQLPEFATILVIYKRFIAGDWQFARFEIISSNGHVINSNRYCDLPLFLAMAKELVKPKKRSITIEEINGSLAENARTVKVKDVKTFNKGRILTAEDFLSLDYANNPGCDMDDACYSPYSDLPHLFFDGT